MRNFDLNNPFEIVHKKVEVSGGKIEIGDSCHLQFVGVYVLVNTNSLKYVN